MDAAGMRTVLDERKHRRDLKLRLRKAMRPGSSHCRRTITSRLFGKTPTVGPACPCARYRVVGRAFEATRAQGTRHAGMPSYGRRCVTGRRSGFDLC
jgi:hypothetical protein